MKEFGSVPSFSIYRAVREAMAPYLPWKIGRIQQWINLVFVGRFSYCLSLIAYDEPV